MEEQAIQSNKEQMGQEVLADQSASEAPRKSRVGGFFKGLGIAAVCCVIFFGILAYAGYVVSPKDNGPDSGVIKNRCYSILAEPDNSLDMVVIGDSVASDSIDPMVMWKESGIASYNASFNGMRSANAVSILRKVLQEQSPKVVVLEADLLYNYEQPESVLYQTIDDLFPVAAYHHRWTELTLEDFYKPINYTQRSNTKGYQIREKITSVDPTGYMEKDKDYIHPGKISEACVQVMKDMCDKAGVGFVLVASPSVIEWSHGKHNAMQDMSEKIGFTFLDLNTEEGVGIDWSCDSRDMGTHMNYKGAEKVTRYLMNYAKQTYGLPDHRGEASYDENWNTCLIAYEEAMVEARAGRVAM